MYRNLQWMERAATRIRCQPQAVSENYAQHHPFIRSSIHPVIHPNHPSMHPSIHAIHPFIHPTKPSIHACTSDTHSVAARMATVRKSTWLLGQRTSDGTLQSGSGGPAFVAVASTVARMRCRWFRALHGFDMLHALYSSGHADKLCSGTAVAAERPRLPPAPGSCKYPWQPCLVLQRSEKSGSSRTLLARKSSD